MKKTLLLLFTLLITGCNNYKELNSLAIASAIEIDKIDSEYIVNVQIINPQKQNDTSNSNQPKFYIYNSKGKTISEALINLTNKLPKKIYGMHLELLILSDRLVKGNLKDIINYFVRNAQIRKEFYVVVGKQNNLLVTNTPLINISSKKIIETLKINNKELGISKLVTFNDMLDIVLDNKKELILPSIKIIDYNNNNPSKTNKNNDIVIDGLAIFKKELLVGFLSSKESIIINLINNDINKSIITLEDNKRYISFEIINSKANISFNKNNNININVNGNIIIKENTNNLDNNILKQKFNNYIENLIEININNIVFNYKTDIFNIQDLINKTDYNYYSKIKNKYYQDIFNNLKFNIKVNYNIKNNSNIIGNNYE